MKRMFVVVMALILGLGGTCTLAEEDMHHDLGCTTEDILQALYLEDDEEDEEYVSYYYRFYNNGDNLNDYEGLSDLGLRSYYPLCPGTLYQDDICFVYALSTDVKSRNVNLFIFTYEVPDGIGEATAAIETGLAYWNRVIEACSEDVQEAYTNAQAIFEPEMLFGYGSNYAREYYSEECAFSCAAMGNRICYVVTSFTQGASSSWLDGINWIEYEVNEYLLEAFAEDIQEQSEFSDDAEVGIGIVPGTSDSPSYLAPIWYVNFGRPDNYKRWHIKFYGSEMEAIKYTQTTMEDYYFPFDLPDGFEYFQYRYKNMSISGYCTEPEEQIDAFRAAVLAWEKVFGNK